MQRCETVAHVVLIASICVPVYAYFGYLSVLVLLGTFRTPRHVRDLPDEGLPPVTMIVSAHNEAAVIADKVLDFLGIDYPADKLTLLIGSDGSDDGTTDVALMAAQGSPRVRAIRFDTRRGKASVLNDLVVMASEGIVVVSDANTMYEADAVRKLVRHFADPLVGAVCGRLALSSVSSDACLEEGLYWRYENTLKRLESDLGALVAINGQVMAFRRGLFAPLPADAITEDQYLGMMIMLGGHRVRFDPSAVATETVGSLDEEKRRRLRISAGNIQTLVRVGLPLLNPLSGFPAFAYLSHKVMRWMVPFALGLSLISSGLLWRHEYARILLVAQVSFYGAAAVAAVFPLLRRLPPVRLVHYFAAMNARILLGFASYAMGRQTARWRRSAR